MDIGVLGPLTVSADGRVIEVPGLKERALLARLAAEPGRTVPVDALTDALWGQEPPANVRKVLQTYVLRVRNAVEPGRDGRPSVVITDAGGYRLAVGDESVDAVRFARLVDEARLAARRGRHVQAVEATTAALALWRGPAYAGLEQAEFAVREARRLDELRLTAEEVHWASEIALGNHHAAIPALETLVKAHPWREGLWSALVLALYRSGRQGDALAAYARARTQLDEDLGVEPGAELRELHRRVLAQDPDLDLVGLEQLPRGLVEPEIPMVGRADELAELTRAWERAARGSTVVAEVVGPEGSGRRRLLQAFASQLAESGVRVLEGPEDHFAGPVLHVLDEEWCQTCARTPRAMLAVRTRPDATAYPVRPDLSLELGPLDEAAARQLVAAYLPTEDADELVRVSADRRPAALHALARTRVRGRARERIGAAASALGEAAEQLTHQRTAIADAAVTWQEHAPAGPQQPTGECPWRGLAAYGHEDRAWFAGRDRLAAELLARVASGRLVAVVGASGSGKSSLVHAGLLGGLADGLIPGSDAWVQIVMRPGAHPMRELSRAALEATGQETGTVGDALARLLTEGDGAPAGGRDRVPRVLVVDQFEEAWTLCQDAGEREAFLDTLVELATVGAGRTVVVVAVRADYVAHLANHPALARLVADNGLLVGVPTPAEVQRAIEVPAERAGLVLDAGLAATIVEDAGSEPGLLPLLSAALTQLWLSRKGARLGYAAYVAMGGLPGAIAHLAEDAWQALPEEDGPAARALLLRLAGPGEGSTVVRRRVPLDELVGLPGEGTARTVDRLVAARLLTVSEGTVEVAHEALFREWPRLAGWLAEDVTGRAVLRRLALAASEWDAEGREPQQLWRGTRLVSGLEVAETYPGEVTAVEHDFLAASSDAVEAEQHAAEESARRTRVQNARLRRLLVGVAGLLVVALVAGGLAVLSRQEAAAARDVAAANELAAEAKQLAAQAVNEEYHDLALLQAVEAVRSEESPETLGALLTRLVSVPKLIHQVRSPDRFLRAAVSPDGSTVFVSENEPVLWALDAVSGEVLWRSEEADVGARTLDVGEAGLLVGGYAGNADGAGIFLVDASDGHQLWTVEPSDITAFIKEEEDKDEPVDGFTTHALWTGPDSWVTVTGTHVVEGDSSGRLTRAVPADRGHHTEEPLALWPDGRIAVIEGEQMDPWLIDPTSEDREPEQLPGRALRVSPDGTLFLSLVADGRSGTLRLHRTEDLSPAGEEFTVKEVKMAEWSPDGSLLAVGTAEAVTLRDGATGAEVDTLTGHSGAAMHPVFAGPDGSLVWSAGRDGLINAWDLSGERSVLTDRPGEVSTLNGSVDLAGRVAVAHQGFYGDQPNRAYLLDPMTGKVISPLTLELECVCQPVATAVAGDGSVAATVHAFYTEEGEDPDQGLLALWSTEDGRLLDSIELGMFPHGVDLDRAGRVAVVNAGPGYAVVDLATEQVARTELPFSFRGWDLSDTVAITRDGSRVAIARDDGVAIVGLPDGEVLLPEKAIKDGEDLLTITSLEWNADGSVLVLGSLEGTLHFLDGHSLEPVAPPRLTVGGYVLSLAVSPDGSLLVNTGSDGEARLWDTATWSPLGQPFVEAGQWTWAVFADDGSQVSVFAEGPTRIPSEIDADPENLGGRLFTLPTDPEQWVSAACSVAGRNLSQSEWDVIRPGQPWRPTCEDPTG
ncbi:BTAD domain-containing putative transcriptional regulator [Ornithinimicrobium tianjinense]|nr:BTAD domain-containing putative transcriptional regulator [Ornithinimicrobium tianjinense]